MFLNWVCSPVNRYSHYVSAERLDQRPNAKVRRDIWAAEGGEYPKQPNGVRTGFTDPHISPCLSLIATFIFPFLDSILKNFFSSLFFCLHILTRFRNSKSEIQNLVVR